MLGSRHAPTMAPSRFISQALVEAFLVWIYPVVPVVSWDDPTGFDSGDPRWRR